MKDWLENFWFEWSEYIWVLVIAITIVGGLLGCAIGGTIIAEKNTCASLQSISTSTDYQFQWLFWGGCRVNINGFWMHYSDVDLTNLNIKMMQEEK